MLLVCTQGKHGLLRLRVKKWLWHAENHQGQKKVRLEEKEKKSAGFIESQDSHQQLRALVVFLLEVMLRFFAARRRNGAHNSERHSGKINTLHEGEWYLMYCGK